MRDGSNRPPTRTSVRPDPVEQLIAAMLHWNREPSSVTAVAERAAALEALGLPSTETLRAIADARRQGYDIPSAVQRVVLDLTGDATGGALARARAALEQAPDAAHDHHGPGPCPRCGGLPPDPSRGKEGSA